MAEVAGDGWSIGDNALTLTTLITPTRQMGHCVLFGSHSALG
jgi:hypothetical protein